MDELALKVWLYSGLLATISAVTDTELQFIVLGDWGDGFYDEPSNQLEVAEAMNIWASANSSHPQFVITVGDNFYPDGVTSPSDEWFDTKWKLVYNTKPYLRDLPWYISLGNHDYDPLEERSGPNSGGREMNQVKRSEIDLQWNLPSLWYNFERDSPAGQVEFFIVDSDGIKEELNNYTDQVKWINSTIASSTAAVKLVFGHHPIYTIGDRAPGEESLKRVLEPVMLKYHVDAYIAGHEHNFQHIHKADDKQPDHFVFGGGGREITPKNVEAEKLFQESGFETFFHYGHGFGVVTINETSILVQAFDATTGNLLYEDSRTIRNPQT